ncbi:MAG TPA: HAMP domain-containing protein, partial [Actinomycetota bacterium]|nr:HAMP domain-containing protein [Actinomycetota bacterium]
MSRLRYGELPIWAKLLVPFVILIFVWGFFGTLVLVRSRDGEARSRATAQLATAIDTARAAFADEQASLVESVRLASQLPGVREAVGSRDTAALEALLVPVAANGRHRVLRVTDARGEVLVTVDASDGDLAVSRGGSLAEPAVLAAASGIADGYGDKHLGVRDREMFVAGPVLAPGAAAGGPVSGVIVVATDASRVAHELARSTGAAVTLFSAQGSALAASGRRIPFEQPGAGIQASIGGGSPFEAFYAPLLHRGRVFGTLAVGYSAEYILAGVRGTAALWAILIGFGVAAATGIGIVATRAVALPVGRLVETTEELERGDLSARAAVMHGDEIGRLAESFNRMAAQLEAGHAELER